MQNAHAESIAFERRNLIPIGERPSLSNYLEEIWKLRHFIFSQARYRSLSGGKGTFLGRAWLILDPLLRIFMYYIIFAVILNSHRGIDNFIAYLAIGLITFIPVTRALNNGASFADRNRSMLRSFAVPRASLVITESIRDAYNAIPEVIALLIFIIAMPPHVSVSSSWLMYIPILLFRQLAITGICFVTARLHTAIPDLKNVWPLLTRFLFYASGVVFPLERMPINESLKSILTSNPGFILLDMSRSALLRNEFPSLNLWLQLIGWSVGVFVIGFLVFWRAETKYNRLR